MTHHPSIRLARRLAEFECRPILEIARLSVIWSSSLNTPSSTSTEVFCVSNSEAAALAPPVTFEPLLIPAEAAKLLRMSADTLLKMARAKLLPAIRIGKHWRFRASSLNAYIESQTQKEPPTICASKSSPAPKPRLRERRPGGALARFRAMNSVPSL